VNFITGGYRSALAIPVMRTTDRTLARGIFIGDSGVGKTSLITRITLGTFGTPPPPTVGALLRPVAYTTRGRTYRFHLWDTAGQEVYRSIVPLYFRQATCALVVFSVADPSSFRQLDSWLELLYSHTAHSVPAFVIGNKIDVPNPAVAKDDVAAWAERQNVPVFYTSAATGAGIDPLLEHVAAQIAPLSGADDTLIDGGRWQCC
jgi:small GTP-binding protein